MAVEDHASPIHDSELAAMERVLAAQRRGFESNRYPTLSARRERLDRLAKALRAHDEAICDAISADFGNRAREETRLFEQFTALEGLRYTHRRLRSWMRSERRSVAWWSLPASACVLYQPLGVVGIIVPWNYPLYLATSPLIAALAAGNRVMLKMSEFTPQFGALFERVIAEAFAEEEVAVFNGAVDVARRFAALPFDHLLFTGATAVGRQVMKAAAENLTPVTLELGGKSPVIIGEDFELDEAARRIMFGKLANCGQTCVAPDYVLLAEGRAEEFIAACRRAAAAYYPSLTENSQYTSIVNDRQFSRLQGYLDDARAQGAIVHPLHDEATCTDRRRFSPVALTGVGDGMRVMQEEIFGPILPVVPYSSLGDAIRYVNARPRPLALYYFGGADRERVLRETISGGVTVNNTMFHVAQDDLPFGGIGPSGMGQYHGPEGFRTFSKARAVCYDGRLSGSVLLRPPFGRLFRWMMRLLYR